MSSLKQQEKAILGARLKTARDFKGLTQGKLAEILGYPGYSAIKDLETGVTLLKKPIAKLIGHELGISEVWLLTGAGDMCFRKEQSSDKKTQLQSQEPKDSFDQAMDEFFEMVKKWQIDENGRNMKTAIEFFQEFPLRFPEMGDWLKKRGGGGDQGRLQEPVRKIV